MKKILFLLSFLLPSLAVAQTFPTLSGTNLNDVEFVLPADLEGAPRVLILAFEREHQELVNPWLEALAEMQKENPNLRYYEIPTMDEFNMLVRWGIAEGMRSGIADEAARARTISLHLPEREAEMAKLGITDLSTIYTLVLDAKGQVVMRIKGAMDDEKRAQLKRVSEQVVFFSN